MKRAVIFAHYDKDSIIDDYVVYYLKALKNCIEKVIFVSCNNLPKTEKDKLINIADYIISEEHKEYDFGSYKRGFENIKEEGLSNYEEIIFANDSCYGPLFSFETVLETMEEKDCDFWGLTKNYFGIGSKTPHIQSYFIVLRKKAFMSGEFLNFISNIKNENGKNTIIKNYEIGLSQLLYRNGFKDAVYIDTYKHISNPVIKRWKPLILKYKMPLLKCNILRLECINYTTVDNWQEVVRTTDYPVELIENNLARTRNTNNKEFKAPVSIKEFIFGYILVNTPEFIRRQAVKALKIIFS